MPLKIQLLIETTMAHHTLIAFDSLRLPKFSPNFLIKPKLARSWRQDRPVKDYRVMRTFGQEIVVKTKNLTFFTNSCLFDCGASGERIGAHTRKVTEHK